MRRHGMGRAEVSLVEAGLTLVGVVVAGVILWHMIAHADRPTVDAHFLELSSMFTFSLGAAFNRGISKAVRARSVRLTRERDE
jgi:hypothetical protein